MYWLACRAFTRSSVLLVFKSKNDEYTVKKGKNRQRIENPNKIT